MNGASTQPQLLKKIENYVFKFSDLLGQGNFSKVYKGLNQITNQTVAIKVIQLNSLKSPKLQELLFSEIQVLKKLNHPNILKCSEVFSSNRNCYIITEICNEGDLQTKIRKQHHLSQQQAQTYIVDIFKGLKYLSDNNVVHRDIKVANIFLNNNVAKIADFGFSKITADSFRDMNIGSPIYMSPEGYINNIYGPKTDVWAFGIFIYELLHGITPYSHCQNQSELKKQIMIPITYSSLKTQLSFQIKDIILKCLEINQQKRASIEQLANSQFIKILMKKYDTISLGPNFQVKGSLKNSPSNRYTNKPDTQNNKYQQRHFSQDKNRYTIKSRYGNRQTLYSMTNNQNSIGNTDSKTKQGFNSYPITNNLYPNLSPSNHQSIRPFSVERNSRQRNYNSITKNIGRPNVISKNEKKINIPVFTSNRNMIQKNQIIKNSDQRALNGILSFKQAVNILHYCRLIYKYIILSRDIQEQFFMNKFSGNNTKNTRVFASWMFKILGEMSKKIQNREIYYEDDSFKKQSKLKEVTNQYYKKYIVDIEKPFSVQSSFESLFKIIDEMTQKFEVSYKNKPEIVKVQLAHFLMVIYEATNLLKKCSNQKKFMQWGQYKYIEQFLSQNKTMMTYSNYMQLKQRNFGYI